LSQFLMTNFCISIYLSIHLSIFYLSMIYHLICHWSIIYLPYWFYFSGESWWILYLYISGDIWTQAYADWNFAIINQKQGERPRIHSSFILLRKNQAWKHFDFNLLAFSNFIWFIVVFKLCLRCIITTSIEQYPTENKYTLLSELFEGNPCLYATLDSS
jgi:hypothetical protein